ncbi:hypothetical protein CC78DRAFT_528459 [Lojkania enalia]|uniref:Uncharacterized protein n=1 Tax=Lojkania enalia TaxID=147567 RepID=A0A9P4NCS5_9PLEO|nr:hypothetical protein CC78DRAFT_528459 [Didymosphaeria enalia]
MAQAVAPGSQALLLLQQLQQERQPQQQQQPGGSLQNGPHGKKRAAENGLENEQRLSKRFDLLNLTDSNGTRLFVPVAGSSDLASSSPLKPAPKSVAPVTKKRERKPRPPAANDGMEVEDTPHRVYIHDLAAELSDVESDEDNPIFIADIEKHLSKIPRYILKDPELKATKDNALVLYNVPSSLTVPEEQDKVRKAIVEARARIRHNQASPVGEPERIHIASGAMGNPDLDASMAAEDPDAMELD